MSFHDLFLMSELAALMYCDEFIDGNGMPLARGLTKRECCVRLDKSGSVSALVEGEGDALADRSVYFKGEHLRRRFLNVC